MKKNLLFFIEIFSTVVLITMYSGYSLAIFATLLSSMNPNSSLHRGPPLIKT